MGYIPKAVLIGIAPRELSKVLRVYSRFQFRSNAWHCVMRLRERIHELCGYKLHAHVIDFGAQPTAYIRAFLRVSKYRMNNSGLYWYNQYPSVPMYMPAPGYGKRPFPMEYVDAGASHVSRVRMIRSESNTTAVAQAGMGQSSVRLGDTSRDKYKPEDLEVSYVSRDCLLYAMHHVLSVPCNVRADWAW